MSDLGRRPRGRQATLLVLLTALALALAPRPATADQPMARPYLGALAGFQRPEGIAVDQANGDVYVLDIGTESISRFDSALQPANFAALGTNVIDGAAIQNCTGAISPDCDRTPFNGFFFDAEGAAQIAIDDSGDPLTEGDIYVTDSVHHLVTIFAPSGAYLGALDRAGTTGAPFGEVCGVAIDAAGRVYVSDLEGEIHKFTPTTDPPTDADFSADLPATEPCGLAVGTAGSAGSIFVDGRWSTASKLDDAGAFQYELSSAVGTGVAVDPSSGDVFASAGSGVAEYDASGAVPSLLGTFGSNQIESAGGVAVDGASGKAYVSDSTAGKVYVYGPSTAVPLPKPGLGPYAPRSATSVELVGYVDGGPVATTYHFEYCVAASCVSLPAGRDETVGKGVGPSRVSQVATGLEPGGNYSYRLVASNAAGSMASTGGTFSTPPSSPSRQCPNAAVRAEQGSGTLPDCRAYELVSEFPSGRRNGVEILLDSERVRAAAQGEAFKFSSLGGAADIQGVPFAADYMAVRDPTAGWAVHGVTPKQESVSLLSVVLGGEPRYVGEFSPDLSRGIFLSSSPLNEEGPNVRSIFNLYRRDDLREPGPGSYELLTDAIAPQSVNPAGKGEDEEWPKLAGVSTDLSHVVFESSRDLTAEAATLGEGPRLYEWSAGALRLVGILPAAEGGGPSIARAPREFNRPLPGVVSADGSRLIFAAPPFEGSEAAAALYLRDDRGTADPSDDFTVKVNATEKTNGTGVAGADPDGPQAAVFDGASADLGEVFFRSTEALTDDAPTDEPGVYKLYRYQLDAPSGSHLTLLSVDANPEDGISDEAEGTVGASEDGSYVYFVGANELVADRPATPGPKLYVWHDGIVHQVTAINAGVELQRLIGREVFEKGGHWARVSADGKELIFVTEGSSETAGYDQGDSCPADGSAACKEVYLYSAAATPGGESLQCVSCLPGGQPADADADFNSFETGGILVNSVVDDPYLNRALADRGRRVFFTTAERLSPYDENSSPDVYEFDVGTGSVNLISGGRPGAASEFLDASADGDDVFFMTRSALLGGDDNQLTDVYDARVGGGFAEGSAPAPPCDSTAACRPVAGPDATSPAPASLLTVPTGRTKQRHVRHRRHRHRKHHKGKRRGHGHRRSRKGAGR